MEKMRNREKIIENIVQNDENSRLQREKIEKSCIKKQMIG
jgi:hypothetical protein